MGEPILDLTEVRSHLERYRAVPGQVNIWSAPSKRSYSYATDPDGLSAAAERVRDLDAQGEHSIYLRGTTVARAMSPGERGGDDDSSHWIGLSADIDYGKPGYAPTLDEAVATIAAAQVPEPSELIASGHGVYPVVLFDEPVPDGPDVRALAADYAAELRRAFEAAGYKLDPGLGKDAARVWRIPGTVNRRPDHAAPVACRAITGGSGVAHPVDSIRATVPMSARSKLAAPWQGPDEGGLVNAGRSARFTDAEAHAYGERFAWGPLREAVYGQDVNVRLNEASLVVGHFVRDWYGGDADRAAERIGEVYLAEVGRRYGWRTLDGADRATIESGLRRGMEEPYRRITPEDAIMPSPDGEDGYPGEDVDALAEQAYARLKARRIATRRLDAEEAGEPAAPTSTSLRDLLTEPDEDPTYLVHGIWPTGGKVVLSAQQKAGKTTMVGNLVRSLADGDPVLGPRSGSLVRAGGHGGFAVTPLAADEAVFVIDSELDRRMIRRWLREHSIRNPDRVFVETFRGLTWDPRDDKVRAQWARHLSDLNVRVLILDPLAPILSSLDIDEIDNKGVGQFLHAMDALVLESGAQELLITHHTTHDGERGRGASVLRGWPDAEWRFVVERPGDGREPEPGAARFFAATGRDVAVAEQRLEFAEASRTLTIAGGNRNTHAVDKHTATLVHIVEDQPGLTKRDLRDAMTAQCSVRKETADKVIAAAVSAGLVHTHDGPRGANLHHIGPPSQDCGRCLDDGKVEWKMPG
jgi:hypothetical protein